MKREVATKKRRVRCAASNRRASTVTAYLKQKEQYEKAAKQAQIRSWKEFCERQDREGLWEGIYRVIKNTGKREEDLPLAVNGVTLGQEGSTQLLADTFYPEDKEEDDNNEHRYIRAISEQAISVTQDRHEPKFTMLEMVSSIESFNPKKAPGIDGLTIDLCKQSIMNDGDF